MAKARSNISRKKNKCRGASCKGKESKVRKLKRLALAGKRRKKKR